VLLQLGAELQGEDVRARILHAEPLDTAAAKTQKGLRIFVRDDKPLESIAKRLESTNGRPPADRPALAGGEGEVTLIMMLDLQTEVEMKLPGRFRVSPQIAGAIKAVAGVVDVQAV
jgi:DNA polymerase-3 subunit alpha